MPRAASASSMANNFRELQGLYRFFSDLFPWFNAPGAGTDGAIEARPTEEEIESRVVESGLDEDMIEQRSQRMMELQAILLAEQDDMGRADGDDDLPAARTGPQTPDGLAQAARVAEAERLRRAHVEDAGDE
jgi:hypothetical protein